MKISTLGYSAKEGLKNIYKNRLYSMASIGTIAACLFIFGLFYIVIANFQHMVHVVESEVGITVLFDEGISLEKIEGIGNIIQQKPEVASITYISPEEAWERFKVQYFSEFEDLVSGFDQDNPLKDSASFEIYLNDISKQESFVEEISKIDGVRMVNRSKDVADTLVSFNMLIAYISIAISVILLCVSVFLISNTVMIGITVRKEEIGIMKLIGATDFFVRSPFIVEGIIIGLVGASLPLLIIYMTYNKVIQFLYEKYDILSSFLNFVHPNKIFATLIPISMFIGVSIGFVGSYVTTRKHLEV